MDEMAAQIMRLRTRGARLRADQIEHLRQGILALEIEIGAEAGETRTIGRMLALLDRQSPADNGWTFVMINALQFDAVMGYLLDHAHSPKVAARVWTKCLTDLRRDTGEVMLSRADFAERVGASPDQVTRVLSLLVKCGALIRLREGAGVSRYFVNPLVGTQLGGQDRDRAQAEAPALNLPNVPNNVAQLHNKSKQTGVVQS